MTQDEKRIARNAYNRARYTRLRAEGKIPKRTEYHRLYGIKRRASRKQMKDQKV